MLSFGKNQNVKIFSKGDGTQQDIWGVEVRRPFTFLKVTKLLYKKLQSFPWKISQEKIWLFSREIGTLYN